MATQAETRARFAQKLAGRVANPQNCQTYAPSRSRVHALGNSAWDAKMLARIQATRNDGPSKADAKAPKVSEAEALAVLDAATKPEQKAHAKADAKR
jgi:hypothetical protein